MHATFAPVGSDEKRKWNGWIWTHTVVHPALQHTCMTCFHPGAGGAEFYYFLWCRALRRGLEVFMWQASLSVSIVTEAPKPGAGRAVQNGVKLRLGRCEATMALWRHWTCHREGVAWAKKPLSIMQRKNKQSNYQRPVNSNNYDVAFECLIMSKPINEALEQRRKTLLMDDMAWTTSRPLDGQLLN